MPATAFTDAQGVAVPFAEIETTYNPDRWQMPLPLLKALARQKRSYCDISVTELVGPPQIRVLKARHEYALDPFDLIWASFGTALHQMLELRSEAAAIAEMKLVVEFDVPVPNGRSRRIRLGGTADHFDADHGPQDQVETYIRDRLAMHVAAELAPDYQLPECTPDETWHGRRCEHWCEVAHLCCQSQTKC